MAEQPGNLPVGRGARVLVIDDDRTILDLIHAVLADEGFHVDTALSGDEAVNSPPYGVDLVVLDMFLPGLSGVELTDALRAKYGADLPILVTSASPVAREAHAIGAYEYLAKPFDLVDLVAAIRRGLDSAPQ